MEDFNNILQLSQKMQEELARLTKLGHKQIDSMEDTPMKVFLKESMTKAVSGKMDVNVFLKELEKINDIK